MPLGTEKAALMGAAGGAGSVNYMGDGSLGACTFGDSSITQTGHSTAIDNVLTTGSEAGGPGTSSYGHGDGTTTINQPTDYDAAYELTVANTSGSYDGDCVVANFGDLTIAADVLLTTDRPCRGLFLYVDGDLTVNGTLSMSCRGGHANPTSAGGSDNNAVAAAGIQLGLITDGGSSSFTNDGTSFNGAGTAVRTAIANQDDLSSNGTILTVSKTGGAGGAGVSTSGGGENRTNGNNGVAGSTGGITLSTGGGGSGSCKKAGASGSGGAGGCFSGGAGSGGTFGQFGHNPGTTGNAGSYGGAGSNGLDYHTTAGDSGAGGAGNPAGTGSRGGNNGKGGEGVGGMMWIVCGGDVLVASGGKIACNGMDGGGASGSGGGAGGGTLFIAHFGSYTNNGTVQANGGSGQGNPVAGNGGAGGVHTIAIS